MRIAVLGAGAWGTALAIAFARRHQVTLWARNRDQVEAMAAKRENTRYLKDCPFPDELRLQVDYRQAISDADLLIIASPLSGLRDSLVQLRDVQQVTPFLWVCKGLEATTGLLPHQVVAEVLGDKVSCGVLTGPSFALELARGLPTVVTLASTDETFALATAKQLHGGKLRVYATDDVIGAEIGGAVKNVMAIATGISDGMNLGANCRAALLTRGLAEITRFGVALGGKAETFTGLSGMGDLFLTCTGDLSRNRRVGLLLASGMGIQDIKMQLGHVAEGVPAAREVARRADELGVYMPITQVVCAIVEGRMTAEHGLQFMMASEAGVENDTSTLLPAS
ncbi:MAG: NAD(P)-dependent glycerol-3-phosphate dehydrogenase [Rhodocyclaceae bacterium]|nr:NAD(P)-dependent glycerol-3-phosphate dehydrogenase [Rhodocyclaceae bacterium]